MTRAYQLGTVEFLEESKPGLQPVAWFLLRVGSLGAAAQGPLRYDWCKIADREEIERLRQENENLKRQMHRLTEALFQRQFDTTEPYNWNDDSMPQGPEGPSPSF